MKSATGIPGYAALLGDLTGSRRHADRAGLQDELRGALEATNDEIEALVPLAITVGDEVQALYGRPSDAVAAALRVRARMVGSSDMRFGIGWGVLTVFDPAAAPLGQDGPAWWAARDAIEEIDRSAGARDKVGSTLLRVGDPVEEWNRPTGLPEPRRLPDVAGALLNAFLVCRDEVLGRMDRRDARLLVALLRSEKQAEVAAAEGISQAAVSQRYGRNGSYALRRAEDWLAEAGL